VTEVFANPFGGGALAWRADEDDPLTPLAEGVLGLASPAKDDLADSGDGLAELVVMPFEHSTLGDAVLRTGYVCGAGAGIPAPAHTVGEHVLVRGVWLALPRIDRALAKIDGVAAWDLGISRQGTLDAVTLTVTFGRESLVGNPMWKSRIEQAIRALTPVTIKVEIAQDVLETPRPGAVNDLRGHHLGRDRTLVT
jgi:phenylacetate-CoA ligase